MNIIIDAIKTLRRIDESLEINEDNIERTINIPKCYIIEVYSRDLNTNEYKVCYKVGETSKDTDTRPETLVRNYNDYGNRVGTECIASIIGTFELPYNEKKQTRANDKMIHNELKKRGYIKMNPNEAWNIVHDRDGIDEFFRKPDWQDCADEIVNEVKNIIADIKKTNTYSNVLKISSVTTQTSKHVVEDKLAKVIDNFMKKLGNSGLFGLSNKSILLVGQFSENVVAALLHRDNEVTVLPDHGENLDNLLSNNSTVNKDKLYIINNTGNIEAEVMNLTKKHFDYIIANPPYGRGNEITKAIIDSVPFTTYINLMPLSKYQDRALFKHVAEFELVNPKLFKDASITNNLIVARLTAEEQDTTYQQLSILTYDPAYRDFYELNVKCPQPYKFQSDQFKKTVGDKLDPSVTFITYCRSSNGVEKKDNLPYHYNVLEDVGNEAIYYGPQTDKKTGKVEYKANLYAFIFKTPTEKHNLARLWYKNKNNIMNDLLLGLRKTSGTINDAIPNIDYSKERPYEELTKEDLIKILKEEHPNV